MFLCGFLSRHWPQTLVHVVTFKKVFRFLSFLAGLMALTYWLPDQIWLIFIVNLFQGQIWNLLYLSFKWSDCHETKTKHIDLNSRPQMWPSGLTLGMILTLKFQGQIWNLLHLSQKWSSCHKTKSKHIDWPLGLKCDHRVWPWPWPWPWIFKVKYGIHCIFWQNVAIAMKQKMSISIEYQASNVVICFDLGHNLDHKFSRSNFK